MIVGAFIIYSDASEEQEEESSRPTFLREVVKLNGFFSDFKIS
jgi:hypothetical protein